MKENKARFMMALAMTVFGTIGLFVRRIGLPSGFLALCRAGMATIVVGVFLLASRQNFSLKAMGKAVPILLLSGCAMGFNWILLFEAYRYTTVSIATLSYYFAPVIVTVLCPVLFREKMGLKQWLCFGMSTLGLVLITGLGNLEAGHDHLTGIGFGLGAACLYATVILLNKKLKNVAGLPRTFWQFVASVLVLIPYVLFSEGIPSLRLDAGSWLCLLAVGFIHTGLAYCLYFSSLQHLSGQKVAILSYIDPLIAVVLSVTVLHEPLSAPQVLGGALILGFTLWNELPAKNQVTQT